MQIHTKTVTNHSPNMDKRCHDSTCREGTPFTLNPDILDHIALLCQIAANRPDIVKAVNVGGGSNL